MHNTPRKKEKPAEDSYVPHEALVDNLKRRLRFEIESKEIDHARAELKDIELTDEQTAQQKEELDRLDKMKVDILNKYVFPSMANIIVFLEYCKNPLLREVFDKDIEELLLGIPQKYYNDKLNDYTKYEDQTVIARFLAAILAWRSRKYPYTFTLKLFPIIQRAITGRILAIAKEKLGDKMLKSVVVNNFGGAAALAEFISKDIKINKNTRRPVKF